MPISLGIPMVLSNFPAFIEFQDRLPIVTTPHEAAAEIDRIFSDEEYATTLSEMAFTISNERSWDKIAKCYLAITKDADYDFNVDVP